MYLVGWSVPAAIQPKLANYLRVCSDNGIPAKVKPATLHVRIEIRLAIPSC